MRKDKGEDRAGRPTKIEPNLGCEKAFKRNGSKNCFECPFKDCIAEEDEIQRWHRKLKNKALS